jgi:hypothetical protein
MPNAVPVQNDYYDADGDTGFYWLDWSPTPGRRYQP